MIDLAPETMTLAVAALAATALSLLNWIVTQIADDNQPADWTDEELALLNCVGIEGTAIVADSPAHRQVAGWVGVPGECGAECACGTTFDNFDTIAEAAGLLDVHIAAANSSTSAPAREPS